MALEREEERVARFLDGLAVSVGATRGRVYWSRSGGAYRLSGSFGFPPGEGPDTVLSPDDDLLERIGRVGVALATPIAVGSRIAGVLELQEKAGGGSFNEGDLRRVERAIQDLVSALEREDVPDRPPEESEPQPALGVPPRIPRPVSWQEHTGFDHRSTPSRQEVLVYKGFANALLANPDLEAVVFSRWGRNRADLYVGARRPFSEAARRELLRSLESAVETSVPEPLLPREKLFNTEYPFGRAAGEVERFAGLQTSVVVTGERGLLFTMVFKREPEPETREALKETHRLVRSTLLEARAAERYRTAYQSLVSASLEPGRQGYPKLKRHGFAVSLLARRFAASLKVPSEILEQITVAGLLHDVGLRELDLPYERIAARRPLDVEEMAIVRRHPIIGAELLERIAFPYPVAPIVRHHHERYDGSGYPDHLIGEEIPYASRLIGIAEAYDAMTAADSYRAALSREAALDAIRSKAGTQFDPDLATRFCAFVRSEAAVDMPPSSSRLRTR
jgi:putative nucleotidyltransferase with HDIG domain